MSFGAARYRLRDLGLHEWRSYPPLLLAAAWSALAFAIVTDPAVSLPYALLALLTVPVFLAGTLALRRGDASPGLRAAALWTTAGTLALAAAELTEASPQAILALPVLVLSGVVFARHPAGGVVLVMLMTGAYGSLTAFFGFPSGELVDLVLAGLWAALIWGWVIGGRREPLRLWAAPLASLAYIAVTAVAIFSAASLTVGAHAFRASTWYMLAFILIAFTSWSPGIHRSIARGMLAVAATVGGYAAFRWLAGPAGEEEALALRSTYTNVVDDELGVFAPFPSRHELAAWCAVVLPFVFVATLALRDRWRVIAVVAAGACSAALMASEVRIGFVAALAGVGLVFLLYQGAKAFPGLHLGTSMAALIAAIAIGGGAFALTAGEDEASTKRYTVLLTDPTRDASYQARVFKWETALAEIDDHPFGQGLGTAGRTEQRYGRFKTVASSNLDNSFLKVAFEQGFVVMSLFAVALALLGAGLLRGALTLRDREQAAFAIAAAGSLAAFAVLLLGGVYIEGLTALAAWLVIGLGAAQISRPRRAGEDAQSGPAQAYAVDE